MMSFFPLFVSKFGFGIKPTSWPAHQEAPYSHSIHQPDVLHRPLKWRDYESKATRWGRRASYEKHNTGTLNAKCIIEKQITDRSSCVTVKQLWREWFVISLEGNPQWKMLLIKALPEKHPQHYQSPQKLHAHTLLHTNSTASGLNIPSPPSHS